MTEFLVRYRFRDKQKRDEFYSAIVKNGIRRLCESEEGCICYEYCFPCDCDREILLVEKWTDPECQKKHTQTKHFALIGKIKDDCGATVSVDVYNAEPIV